MNENQLDSWIQQYVRAWHTNDPQDIGALFTDDGEYYTAPFAAPWRGRDTIVAEWLGRKDEPGTYTFRYEILASTPEAGFVQGWTQYLDPPRAYSNLWVIRLDGDGRCREFTEWWMQHTSDA